MKYVFANIFLYGWRRSLSKKDILCCNFKFSFRGFFFLTDLHVKMRQLSAYFSRGSMSTTLGELFHLCLSPYIPALEIQLLHFLYSYVFPFLLSVKINIQKCSDIYYSAVSSRRYLSSTTSSYLFYAFS